MQSFLPLLAVLVGYLIGSLSFAVIVSRAMGLSDPRTFGSKNPGATNVLRSGSKAAAILTLLLDAAKGWLPVVLVKWYGPAYGLGDGTLALVGLAAFLGHVFPVFFRFVGGKGVATALGVLLGFSGWLGLATALIWLLMAVLFRYSSLASITAALLAPVVYVLGDGGLWLMSKSVALSVAVMSLFLLYRHAENINRLIKGTETKLGKKAGAAPVVQTHAHGHAKHGHRHPPHGDQKSQTKNDHA
ncbi:glycerol-3-phosphate 1-O-acyltransferase PlsY [Rhodoferax sp.]|jgi:glycerol-3-phosphate acyltransferase PlsY|uniref:glycerol-3-phosphate 1-O-acyltransferase PlsY n=1 Tax=Rhodoferax sp. TaxID=50421 RepID=UPI00271FE605|nr:glycerol-3-phosphate 1-O-acyltransferase PlsY [Rhodoferax sp.]MDP2033440.1 glycerol-3-phosphate 1-O-acyltransferase PlsY [Polaromonas sp.]MDO9145276.1 glycerol-3-phosphate 1-O-acyltransferase PlsY [Rhodoferax sp.]MDP1528020.1 glycerol-3-phosphate 1-O-acyltransferase PlsY [Rhodoferax sp.]MDP2439924.1 glycerol-3-phosphate 1-O-acyltransferase PlsY [Rhodoferax sp.]MDP3189965.1 glycerol-3-phosphate 1-O-acyltransferase PlsY [Rhodoferax sp.]